MSKHPASVVIDSATYLLMISLPNIDNVAMSLYDIIHNNLDLESALAIVHHHNSYIPAATGGRDASGDAPTESSRTDTVSVHVHEVLYMTKIHMYIGQLSYS